MNDVSSRHDAPQIFTPARVPIDYFSPYPVVDRKEKDQEAFRKRYFWAYEPANGEGAVPIKLLMMPNGKMMSVERRAEMDAACADRPKIGDHRPNQVGN